MIPTIGRIVHYTIDVADADQINRRRDDTSRNLATHLDRHNGVQLHAGNPVKAGDVFPLVITRVWGDTPESTVNGQVLLDGTDTLWVTSRGQGEGPSRWCEPPRVHTAAAQHSGAQS